VLFIVYRVLNPVAIAQKNPRRIEVTAGDFNQIAMAWLAQGRPPATPEEMKSLVESKVREEILYREALELGLDQEDTIVKRRLAQKMEFLVEDVAALRDPTSEELKAWFEQNSSRFALPARATFHHLYFSPDTRGRQTREAAVRALDKLAGKPATLLGVAHQADPFMFQDYYGERTPEQVANVFGTKFAESVFQLKPNEWQGPIESGYGWHLVWIDSLTPSRVPTFEEMESSSIKAEWLADQRAETKRKMYEAMKARYEIVLPNVPALETGSNGTPPTKEVR